MNTSNFASSLRARWGVFLHLLILLVLPFAAAGPARADDCGMQNMRPCLITERKPSCDINLVESQGMCVRPACGTENARACSRSSGPRWTSCSRCRRRSPVMRT